MFEEGTISLNEALKRPEKTGEFIPITFVRWGDYEFGTTGIGCLDLPRLARPPELPVGYRMEPHDSWNQCDRAVFKRAVALNQDKDWAALYEFDLAIEGVLEKTKSLGIRLHHFCEISFPDLPAYDQDPEYYRYWQWRRINEDLALLSGNDLAEALDQKIWADSANLIAVLRDGSEVPLRDCKTIGNVHHLKVPILHQRGKEDPVTLEYF